MYPFYSRTIDVHAGKNNPRLMGVTEVKIKQYFKHPKYKDGVFYYDVAVIVLNQVNIPAFPKTGIAYSNSQKDCIICL